VIPESNVKNLMLRDDVVQAVAQGKFAIYPVSHVDQGLEILTGETAETVHSRVETRLSDYAERARDFIAPARRPWRTGKRPA
jgi:predicted ATP-dependent protease